ncbi:hypothetical protein [Blautia pseudococcoides]|uniref:hypothetical protein n=1 Tax=Blautia pseudococcoides TaxID=1796616 RepID=UPI0012F48F62|nr:hypothetical protein [Blautia pseudococcoides]QJU16052.1 hypothetical protein HL650_17400 [Blautia pseudococcoides]QQQ91458.1 hypothetical protein I5Q86_14020 [Blautia pseudococcoides]
MKYVRYFLNMLVVCVVLTGCQKTNDEKETKLIDDVRDKKETMIVENGEDLQDGDKINFSLTEGVKFDAIVEMPDINLDTISLFHVIAQKYDGQKLIPSLLGNMPENVKVENRGKAGYGYSFQGNLGSNWMNMDGLVMADEDAYIETDHWNEISAFFPVSYIGTEIQVVIDGEKNNQEFSFATLGESTDKARQYVNEISGFEDVQMYQAYAFNWQQMSKMQEEYINAPENEQAKPEGESMRDWSDGDNCYWIFFEQTIDGIPVLNRSITRQDDLYIPYSMTEVGYTQNGIEYIRFGRRYEILDKQTVKLVSLQEIYETLQKKFEMAFVEDITIDQMKLIYYPLPTKKNKEERWVCDMIPVWQFRIQEKEYTDYIYINAIDNIEIVG